MFNGKVNHMTVIVKGVRDDDYEGCELIIKDFFLYGWYVQELIFDSEEMRNFDNIVDAFKKYIDNEKLSCTLIQRGWRIFLRNDSIPVSEIEYYGKTIRREGKKRKSSKS